MKILDSNIMFESVTDHDLFDMSYTQTSGRRAKGRTLVQGSAINNKEQNTVAGDQPLVLLDRVSISSLARESFKSNYSSSVTSNSRVTINDTGEFVDHGQVNAVEKLMGGIIDKKQLIKLNSSQSAKGPGEQTVIESDQWQMSVTQTNVHFEEETMAFNSRGSVTNQDGLTIDFSLSMEMERSFVFESLRKDEINVWQEKSVLTDPLVINLSGKAPELADMTFSFDLDSDGNEEQISFLKPGSGFLVFDKNNDHKVNNGAELFGPNLGNGFQELAIYDEDQNAWIDEDDAVFSKLSVWTKDEEGNDILTSLKDTGVGAISLSSAGTAFSMKGDDNHLKGQVSRSGVFLFEEGRVGSIQQVDLAAQGKKSPPPEGFFGKAHIPLQETIDERTRLMEGNNKRLMEARFEAQGFAESAREVDNPFKKYMDRIKKLQQEFEETMKGSYFGIKVMDQYFDSDFSNSQTMPGIYKGHINYRL